MKKNMSKLTKKTQEHGWGQVTSAMILFFTEDFKQCSIMAIQSLSCQLTFYIKGFQESDGY